MHQESRFVVHFWRFGGGAMTQRGSKPRFADEWITSSLQEIAPVRKGDLITESMVVQGSVPVIAAGINPAYYHNKPNRPANTITISASGANAGYVGFHSYPIYASDCSTIEESKDYDIKFLYYLLLSRQDDITKMQAGGAQPHVYPEHINKLVICYPPDIAEQRAIAAALADIDGEIDSMERLIAKKRDMKTATMQQLLTGKTRLPMSPPPPWTTIELGDVVLEMKDGGTPSRDNPAYFGGNIYWAVVKDIAPEIYSTKETLTEQGLASCSAKLWGVDSIIISLGATIGNVGIAKVPLATKQGLSGIAVNKEKMLPKFLYYILDSNKSKIESFAAGISIKEVRPSRLQKMLTIPCPPLAEQRAIAGVLADMDGEIDALAQQLAKTRALKAGIMQQLLTGETRLSKTV